MYCPQCGKENPDDARFCGSCGAPLENIREEAPFPQMTEPSEWNGGEYTGGGKRTEGKKKKGWIAVCAAVAVLAAGAVICGIVILTGNRQEAGLEADESQTSQVQPSEAPVSGKTSPQGQVSEEEASGDPQEASWTDLKEYAEEALIPQLGSCGLGPFTSDYVMEDGSLGQDAVHDQKGVIVYSIRDFDGDSQDELLAAVMEQEGIREDLSDSQANCVFLQMYEMDRGQVELKDEYRILEGVLGTADREDDWVFFRPSGDGIYIVGSAWQFHGMYADGTYVSASVLRYEGDRFVEYAADTGVGSDFSDVDITALTDTLADIGGFDDTIRRMREDHMAYFDDSTGEDVFFSIYGENPWLDDREAGDAAREQFYRTQNPAELGEKTVTIYPGQRPYGQPASGSARQEAFASSGQEASGESSGSGQGDSSYYDRLAQLEQREQELEDSATDQVSINRISGEVYEMWDAELNYVYQQLKATLTEEEFQLLKEEELEWIEYRDQQADAAAEEWAGGSGMPMAVNSALSEVTKARVYELADRWISGWRP